MTDLLKLHIQNYFSFKSYATVLKTQSVDSEKCYVKIKCELDYYVQDDNFRVFEINFKDRTISGFLNLNIL